MKEGDLLWPVGPWQCTEQVCDQAGAHREMGGGGSVEQPKLVVAGLQHVLAAWEALHHHLSGSSAPLPVPGFEDATWSALRSLRAPGAVLGPSNAILPLGMSRARLQTPCRHCKPTARSPPSAVAASCLPLPSALCLCRGTRPAGLEGISGCEAASVHWSPGRCTLPCVTMR